MKNAVDTVSAFFLYLYFHNILVHSAWPVRCSHMSKDLNQKTYWHTNDIDLVHIKDLKWCPWNVNLKIWTHVKDGMQFLEMINHEGLDWITDDQCPRTVTFKYFDVISRPGLWKLISLTLIAQNTAELHSTNRQKD